MKNKNKKRTRASRFQSSEDGKQDNFLCGLSSALSNTSQQPHIQEKSDSGCLPITRPLFWFDMVFGVLKHYDSSNAAV